MGLEFIGFRVEMETMVNSNIQSFDWHRMKIKKMTLYIIFLIKKLSRAITFQSIESYGKGSTKVYTSGFHHQLLDIINNSLDIHGPNN